MNLILNPVPEKLQEKRRTPRKINLWLAAQAVKAELFGGEGYEYKELALLVGVTTKNWSKNIYSSLGCNGTHIFHRLDSEALLFVMRTRSKQKAAFFKAKCCKEVD